MLVSIAIGGCFATDTLADPSDSVVTIFTTTKSGSGQGTGFVFGEGGRIATAYHVVQGATKIEVSDRARKTMTSVRIDRIDPKRDIAVLIVDEAASLPRLRISASVPEAQAKIMIAGTPRSVPQQVLHGRVTSAGYISSMALFSGNGKAIFAENLDVLPLDVTIYGGLSGAPVLLNGDTVTGILSGSLDQGRGIGWAIPAKYLVSLMAATAINKNPADMGLWPELSLMRREWAGLNRTYTKEYSADHMATLDALQVSFRPLSGRWFGVKEIKQTFEPAGKGRCNVRLKSDYNLWIDKIDELRAVVKGRRLETVQFQGASFVGLGDGRWCDEFRENFSSLTTFTDVTLSIDDLDTFTQDEAVFEVAENVTECKVGGKNCEAKFFGKKKSSKLEVISQSKIRWSGAIFEKSK